MNTTAPTRTKVPLRSITIEQVEGETDRLIKATVSTWAAARIILARICSTAPKDGGYYKCDFECRWENGETYKGRFDAAHPGSKGYEPADLAAHIRSHVEYLAGYRCPAHMDQATYEHQLVVGEKASPGRGAEARAFLVKYNLKDDPNAKPATIERNDRPRSEPAPILRHPDPAPAKPMDPAAIVATRLQSAETMLTAILADLERALPLLLALKTEDRANDVARYAKAQKQALEIRKALAAVIKARQ